MRFLVVDDSRAMRTYVKSCLKTSFNCQVDDVSSGFEALRLLPRIVYDFVITDINMPDINGLELINFVRKSPKNNNAAIIIISTQTAQKDQQRALNLGANHFLPKPFERSDLATIISSYPLNEVSAK